MPFHLLISLYNEQNESRRHELLTCLNNNLAHPEITGIHVFYEDNGMNTWIEHFDHPKITVIPITSRPTFRTLFKYANDQLPKQKIIIANSDIYFNETLDRITNYNFKNKFFVLSRYNVTDHGLELILDDNDNPNYLSADTWIYQTPLKVDFPCDYQLGTFYCDSFLSNHLFKTGMLVFNPCLSIQTCHLQQGISTSQAIDPKVRDELWHQEYVKNNMKQPAVGVDWCWLEDTYHQRRTRPINWKTKYRHMDRRKHPPKETHV